MIDDLAVGYVCEWDLSSGDFIEHKVHDRGVDRMAVSGDMLVTRDWNNAIRLFNIPTCLFVLCEFSHS